MINSGYYSHLVYELLQLILVNYLGFPDRDYLAIDQHSFVNGTLAAFSKNPVPAEVIGGSLQLF